MSHSVPWDRPFARGRFHKELQYRPSRGLLECLYTVGSEPLDDYRDHQGAEKVFYSAPLELHPTCPVFAASLPRFGL